MRWDLSGRPRWLLFVIAWTALESVAASDPRLPRIGWVYRIEGQLEGRSVVYVGSATDLKQRLSSAHQWSKLLQQEGMRVYALEVFAELDAQASNRKTLLSARNEALRAAEQRAMEHARGKVEKANRKLLPGEKETKVLNEINASADAALWEVRHRVSTGGVWRLLERHSVSASAKAIVALTVFDFYWMYREAKLERYVMAPYVLGDENGFFTLEQETALASSTCYKVYQGEGGQTRRSEVPAEEFTGLKEEAESLWGTTDWRGDFVPGLLNRSLPIIERHDGM